MADPRPAADSNWGERREILYTGRVQGVGFRYTVRHLAGGFQVTGFVRNLPDGRVQLIAEGSRGELNNFLTAISEQMSTYIRDAATDARPATGEFHAFEIRY
jgi:acylphosphatase